MRVVSLLGSPRPKGNSTVIAGHFAACAAKHGADVTAFALNTLDYKGCQGCLACKTKLDKCIVEDDLSEILGAVRACDVLVLSSPVYFGDVSGQLKCFIDRTFSFLTPDYATSEQKTRLDRGKTLVFILTQGHPDETEFADVFPRYAPFFKLMGFDRSHLIRACGVYSLGVAKRREDILSLAKRTAAVVMGSGSGRS